MGRKRCIRARCGAVVVGLAALVSFLPAARAQSGIGEMLRALVSPPEAKLAPAELPGLPDGVDRGLPEAVDPALVDDLRRVMTDPGRIPQLEIDVDGEKRALPLEHTHVSAELSGFVARVEVTQTYRNPLTEPIEAVYVFPLPENSAVDDMKIRIGERLIEAEIQRRAEARATYEAARREGYTAALLEQERPNVFTQSIANMEPGKEIEVVIRYVQDLSYDSGEYEFVFPMVVGPRFFPPGTPTGDKSGEGWARDTDAVPDASRVSPPIMGGGRRTGHDISVEVVLADGLDVQDFRVPTHEVKAAQVDDALVIELANGETIPNRDFVLRYAVDEPAPHGALYAHRDPDSGKGGFFSLVLQPPELDVDELLGRREIIFVIDVSGSMYGRPLAMAKDAARQAIRRLRPVDSFNVITFSGATAKAFPAPREGNTTNIREGLDFIEKARAGGGTMLADAVAEALKTDVEDGRNRTVIFLTDGYVGNEKEIHSLTRRFVKALAEKGQKARAFGFGIGSSVNRHLLDGIGKAGKGATVYLTTREDPSKAVQKVFRIIDKPILSDVKIGWKGLKVADIFPAVMPDLLGSRPTIIHGRYEEAGEATIVITGRADGRKMRIEVPVHLPEQEDRNGALETLWARARIESLNRDLWDGPNKEVVETITALGLEYRLVTAYTSFVAVDRSKKVGDGDPTTIVQPVEAPEGVEPSMAAPPSAMAGKMAVLRGAPTPSPALMGGAGLGTRGSGRGGGGGAYGITAGLQTRAPRRKARIKRAELADAIVAETPSAEPAVASSEDADEEEAGERTIVLRLRLKSHEGGLAEAALRRSLMKRRAALRAIVERRLAQTGVSFSGTLMIRLEIGPNGRVTKALNTSATKIDEALLTKLLATLKRVLFPKADKASAVVFELAIRS